MVKGASVPDVRSPWGSRKVGFPFLPGGHENYLTTLRSVLSAFAAPVTRETLVPWASSEPSTPAYEAAKQLAPAGLVRRSQDGTVGLTEEAQRWLDFGDPAILVEVLHGNLRFVGEMMAEIEGGGLTIAEIAEVARRHYRFDWTTFDQVNRRSYWLRSTGAADLLFTGKLVLTDLGRGVLASLANVKRDQIDIFDAELVPEALGRISPAVAALLENADQRSLSKRVGAGMHFVPKAGVYNTVESLIAQVGAATPSIGREEFIAFCMNEFKTKRSSATSALDTVRNMGLVAQVGRDTFSTTEVARAWRDSNEVLDLVGIVHASIRCVGELLPMLDDQRTVGELAEMARVRFGGLVLKTGVLRNRLQLLREAGLVMQPSFSSYRVTGKGRAFLRLLPLERENAVSSEKVPEITHETSGRVTRELLRASADIAHPENFERAVVAAFQEIGLRAEHLGGPGRTDILITIRRSPTESVRIVVDAKATKNQSILEGAVDFSTLSEHRIQHKADHVALVAIGFDSGRVRSRAGAAGVSLITVDELIGVVERCRVEPLAPVELEKIFTPAVKDKLWVEADRRAEIMAAVIGAIEDESEYVAETGGDFSARDIHRALRRLVEPSPDMAEVQDALGLLASPLIGGVKVDGKGRYLPGIPAESVAARLHFLAGAVSGAASN